MIVKIFVSPSTQEVIDLYQKDADERIVAVEKGAYMLAKNKITMDHAIGDFDSVSDAEVKQIKKYANEFSVHPIEKDKTDTELALDVAFEYNPDKIIIYGGIGTRFDHSYANMLLLKKADITHISHLHKMYVLKPGDYQIDNDYEYISFFALEDVQNLSLEAFYYPLKTDLLARYDSLCISNQGSGKVSFDKGLLLVVHAND